MTNAQRIVRLRRALEWYADRGNYDEDHAPIVRGPVRGVSVFDEGDRARRALSDDNTAADEQMEQIRREAERDNELRTSDGRIAD